MSADMRYSRHTEQRATVTGFQRSRNPPDTATVTANADASRLPQIKRTYAASFNSHAVRYVIHFVRQQCRMSDN